MAFGTGNFGFFSAGLGGGSGPPPVGTGGIYGGNGTVPTAVDATVTDDLRFLVSGGSVYVRTNVVGSGLKVQVASVDIIRMSTSSGSNGIIQILGSGFIRTQIAQGSAFFGGNGAEATYTMTIGDETAYATHRVHITGMGSTSATTGLLVENSSSVATLQVYDDGQIVQRRDSATGGCLTLGSSATNITTFTKTTTTSHLFQMNSSGSAFIYFRNSYSAFADPGGTWRGVKIGGSVAPPDLSAVLQLDVTDKGFLPPVMTTVQRDAINGGTFADGLVVYDSTLNELQFYNGTTWVSAGGGGGNTLYSADDTIGAGRIATITDTLTFTGAIAGFVDTILVNSTNSSLENSGPRLLLTHVADSGAIWMQNGGGGGLYHNALNLDSDLGMTFTAREPVGLATTGYPWFDFFADAASNDARLRLYNYNGASGPTGSHNHLQFQTNNGGGSKSTIAFGQFNSYWYVEGAGTGGTFTLGSYLDTGTVNTPVITILGSSSNDVGINQTTPTAKLNVKGNGATNATTSLLIENSSGDDMLMILDDGTVGINTTPAFQYHQVTPNTTSNTFWKIADSSGNDIMDIFGNGVIAIGPTGGVIGGSGALQVMQRAAGTQTLEIYNSSKQRRLAFGVDAGDYGNMQIEDNAGVPQIVFSADSGTDNYFNAGSLSIGNNSPDASALLDVDSTSKGFLPPRMTTIQRASIVLPATGLIIYNTTTNQWEGNSGTPAVPVWVILG